MATPAKHRRSIDRRLKEVSEAMAGLETITPDWLWEMQRRREQLVAPDGLRSPSLDGGSKSSDDTSTTERTAINSVRGCRQPLFVKLEGIKSRYCSRCGKKAEDHTGDPIGASVEEIFDLLDRGLHALRSLKRRSEVVLLAADGHRGRASSLSDCGACGKPVTGMGHDRNISGYGPCCFASWRKFAAKCDYDGVDASHVVFRIQRKAELDRAAALEREAERQGA